MDIFHFAHTPALFHLWSPPKDVCVQGSAHGVLQASCVQRLCIARARARCIPPSLSASTTLLLSNQSKNETCERCSRCTTRISPKKWYPLFALHLLAFGLLWCEGTVAGKNMVKGDGRGEGVIGDEGDYATRFNPTLSL